MEGTYEVAFGTETIGTVRVSRQGLYYRFESRCEECGGQMMQLQMNQGKQWTVLGLLIPKQNRLVLDTKIPAKRLEEGSARFRLIPRHASLPDTFVPLHPQEPFQWLRQLEGARLEKRGGEVGLVLTKNKFE